MSSLIAWLEPYALKHKKSHHDILGEQNYSGSRLMFLKTIGPFEVKSDRQLLWFEMADKDYRINVAIPGNVVKAFNAAHTLPLHSRRYELLSIEQFQWIVETPPIDAPVAGQTAARKSEPTFGIKVLKLREYGGGGKNVKRGVITLCQGGGKEVKAWIEGLEKKVKGEQAFAREFEMDRQRKIMQMTMAEDPSIKVEQVSSGVDKGKGVDRGQGAPPKKQSRKAFDYSRFEAPRTLDAAIRGCAPHVKQRLEREWGSNELGDDSTPDPQPQASTSRLPPPAATSSTRRRSTPRPEEEGPPKSLPVAESRAPKPEEQGPPRKLPRLDSAPSAARPEEQGPPKSLPARRLSASSSSSRPRRPEEENPPKSLPRMASPASVTRSTTTTTARTSPRATSPPRLNSTSQQRSLKIKAQQPSSPSPHFPDLSSEGLRELDAAAARAARPLPMTTKTTTSSPNRASSVIEWSPSPPRRAVVASQAPMTQHHDNDDQSSPSPPPQAGQRPTDSVHYSQFPQESISVDVSVLEVTSQVPGQPIGGQGRAEEEEDLPPSRQSSSALGSQGGRKRAWEVAEEEAPSCEPAGGAEEEEGEMEWEEEEEEGRRATSEVENSQSESEGEVDAFGMEGGGRKRSRSTYDDDDDEHPSQKDKHGDHNLPSSPAALSQSHHPRKLPSPPPVNYLATSSPAPTHVSNSQPSMPVTQVEEEEEMEGVENGGERARLVEGEGDGWEEQEERMKRMMKSASPVRPSPNPKSKVQTEALPARSNLPAQYQPLQQQSQPQLQPPVVPAPSKSNSPSNSHPFSFTPSQLALFTAEQEAWSRPIELPPMRVFEVPRKRREESKRVGEVVG
ncbi:hypothetical protein BCR35DRAFT_303247 [Leucosporidium creatinivorum]|uniref:Uncharacterized protein n=1 Tax=Leucosporidium creatinivorum TaxID=106004 RepID=A0A1Y2FJL3_9BASI|nr:hypothetical protein BCR35DRAFT_303247 [Leucosporidium creatinivorum]